MPIDNIEEVPDYLQKPDESFEKMLCSVSSMNLLNSNNIEDFRQIAICIHHVKYNGHLFSLWMAYLKSGMGELQTQSSSSRNTLTAHVWTASIKSKVKQDIRTGVKEYDACLTYVKAQLNTFEKNIAKAQSHLNDRMKRLSYHLPATVIQEAIGKFVEDNLIQERAKIQHKIQLVHFDYHERILELQYLQYKPTEAQVT